MWFHVRPSAVVPLISPSDSPNPEFPGSSRYPARSLLRFLRQGFHLERADGQLFLRVQHNSFVCPHPGQSLFFSLQVVLSVGCNRYSSGRHPTRDGPSSLCPRGICPSRLQLHPPFYRPHRHRRSRLPVLFYLSQPPCSVIAILIGANAFKSLWADPGWSFWLVVFFIIVTILSVVIAEVTVLSVSRYSPV